MRNLGISSSTEPNITERFSQSAEIVRRFSQNVSANVRNVDQNNSAKKLNGSGIVCVFSCV